MPAIYDQTTGSRTHLAPIEGYDHPAYVDGWGAAKGATYVARDGERFLRLKEWENPYDALTDSEAFSQWRQGYWAAVEDGERLAWGEDDEYDEDNVEELRDRIEILEYQQHRYANMLCKVMSCEAVPLGKAINLAIAKLKGL